MSRDAAQRSVSSAFELEIGRSDTYDMVDAVPFTDQLSSRDRPIVSADPAEHDVAAVEPLTERLQPSDGRRPQALAG